jgi:hypothetical protein
LEDRTDSVDAGHSVGVCVDVGVGGQRGAVRVSANAGGRVVDPGSHRVALCAGVGGLQADGGGHEVTPALTHAAGLQGGQTVRVGGATSESRGQTTVRVNKVPDF